MKKEIIINASANEIRVAITEDGRLAELFLEVPDKERHVGSIYLGKVQRVVQGMNAAFVDIGETQDAFLHFSDASNVGDDYKDLIDEKDDLDVDDDEGPETDAVEPVQPAQKEGGRDGRRHDHSRSEGEQRKSSDRNDRRNNERRGERQGEEQEQDEPRLPEEQRSEERRGEERRGDGRRNDGRRDRGEGRGKGSEGRHNAENGANQEHRERDGRRGGRPDDRRQQQDRPQADSPAAGEDITSELPTGLSERGEQGHGRSNRDRSDRNRDRNDRSRDGRRDGERRHQDQNRHNASSDTTPGMTAGPIPGDEAEGEERLPAGDLISGADASAETGHPGEGERKRKRRRGRRGRGRNRRNEERHAQGQGEEGTDEHGPDFEDDESGDEQESEQDSRSELASERAREEHDRFEAERGRQQGREQGSERNRQQGGREQDRNRQQGREQQQSDRNRQQNREQDQDRNRQQGNDRNRQDRNERRGDGRREHDRRGDGRQGQDAPRQDFQTPRAEGQQERPFEPSHDRPRDRQEMRQEWTDERRDEMPRELPADTEGFQNTASENEAEPKQRENRRRNDRRGGRRDRGGNRERGGYQRAEGTLPPDEPAGDIPMAREAEQEPNERHERAPRFEERRDERREARPQQAPPERERSGREQLSLPISGEPVREEPRIEQPMAEQPLAEQPDEERPSRGRRGSRGRGGNARRGGTASPAAETAGDAGQMSLPVREAPIVHPESERTGAADQPSTPEAGEKESPRRAPRGGRKRPGRGGANGASGEGGVRDAKLPTFQTKRSGEVTIALEKGQDVIVQVTRESYASKGVRVTTKASLPGRFLVLLPLEPSIGISRKVQHTKERRRLRRIAKGILPEGYGCIIRTVAQDKDEEVIRQDLTKLIDTWREIEQKMKTVSSPALLYKDQSIANTVMRDLFTPDIDRVVIDNKMLFREIRDYVEWAAPNLSDKVELHNGDKPIFEAYGVEKELEKMFHPRVYLPSGGYIILEQTEAMMVIDVNSGRYASNKEQELNSLRTNLEAAREIARQIRLRDIGGLLVVDFIDLYEEKNRKKVYDELKKEMRRDRAKSVVLPMTQFGLVQMTRQRIRQQLIQTISEPCPICSGSGLVQSKSTVVRKIERWLGRFKDSSREFRLTLTANPVIIDYLTEGSMSRLTKLMLKYFVRVKVVPDESMPVDEFHFFSLRQQTDITEKFMVKE